MDSQYREPVRMQDEEKGCPIPKGFLVRIRFNSGKYLETRDAPSLNWAETEGAPDISSWTLFEPPEEPTYLRQETFDFDSISKELLDRLHTKRDALSKEESIQEPKTNAYSRPLTARMKLKGCFDAYDIGTAFELNPMVWAAVKKEVGAGSRNGKKSVEQDIEEAIESLQEYLLEIQNVNT
jgi:hypothetical protein